MFEQAISNHIKPGATCDNVITDGEYTCTYGELPGIFEALDAFLARSGISLGECNILRCGNTLPEALMLLRMLSREQDVLLLPRNAGKVQKQLEQTNLPTFCNSEFSLPDAIDGMNIKEPHSYINIQPNSNYKEGVTYAGYGEGKVFLRTSGSTAEPKLVKHAKKKLFENAANCVERFEIRHSDRVVIPVPIYHMYGLGAGFLPAVIAGASICLIGQTNIIKYLDREKQFKPNVSFMTPTLCRMVLRTRKSPYIYRLVVTAGDRINKTTFEGFETKFGKLVNLYGSTELGAIATSNLNDPLETRSNGIVEPMPGAAVRLRSTGEKIAEILCRQNTGFETYVDKQGKKIPGDEDGWFKTKDLGRVINEKKFKVIGRTGNSMNRSGLLVAFSEVESLMEQGIDGVQHVVVTAKEEENVRGKKMVACCQLKRGTAIDGKTIRTRCFDIMMRHMVPDEVTVMKEIPRLPNGKFDRKKLANLLLKGGKVNG